MKVFIFGYGWLGKGVGAELRKRSVKFSCTQRKINETNLNETIFQYPDKEKSWLNTFQKSEYVLISFPPNRIQPDDYLNQLSELILLASKNQTIIFTSSTGIYFNDEQEMTEESIVNEESILFKAEQIVSKHSSKVILRLGGLIGNERFPAKTMAFSGKEYVGNEFANVLHFEDAVNSVLHFMNQKTINYGIYNVTSPIKVSKEQFYSNQVKVLKLPPILFKKGLNGKWVSSNKLMNTNFEFAFPNPLDFKY